MKQKIKVDFTELKEVLNEFEPNYLTFSIEGEDYKKFNEWNKKHKKKCKLKDKQCAIDGRLTYEFTPTGIGTSIVVKCACGEKLDLTDVSIW
jgi:hypothetical protein